MDKNEIISGLAELFWDNPHIITEITKNGIIFSQDFTNNVHISKELFEKNKMTFSHAVELYEDGSYKLTDKIEKRKLGVTGLSSGYEKGDINAKGFFYGFGKDYKTGEMGPIRQAWSTEDIKAPVREYMEKTGLRKRPSVWWTGKRIAAFFAVIWGIVLLIFIAMIIYLR